MTKIGERTEDDLRPMIDPHWRRAKKPTVNTLLLWVLFGGIFIAVVEGVLFHRMYQAPAETTQETSE